MAGCQHAEQILLCGGEVLRYPVPKWLCSLNLCGERFSSRLPNFPFPFCFCKLLQMNYTISIVAHTPVRTELITTSCSSFANVIWNFRVVLTHHNLSWSQPPALTLQVWSGTSAWYIHSTLWADHNLLLLVCKCDLKLQRGTYTAHRAENNLLLLLCKCDLELQCGTYTANSELTSSAWSLVVLMWGLIECN